MIEVRDLVKRYGRHLAVDHLSFTVPDGQIFGFLGPNGAGKSTTISSLTWESGGTTLTLTKTETETAGTESGDSSSSESAEETEPAWDVNGTAIPSDNRSEEPHV